ncbi:hypothetical protein L7F22_012162 [Adiantum nelumboides]|nr:hypothetical protein [Adiantum nelumboides]
MSVPFWENSGSKGIAKLIDPETASSELIANGVLRSSSMIGPNNEALLPSASAESSQPLTYASSSLDTSPEKIRSYRHQRSLSLPSKCSSPHVDEEDPSYSSGEYSFDGTKLDDGGEMDAARTTSWSEYFVEPGNEVAVDQAEHWMVDLSDLFLGHKFASGAYSRIYFGKYKDCSVAVKMLRKPDNDKGISIRLDRQFNAEVNVLSRVHHRNVVKFIGACKKPPVCCIITEYLALGSVRSYLHYQPFPLALKLAVDMALDIARGMEYLHSQGVIHRDLKSENLVIAEDLCVKITDFGAACIEWESSPMTDDFGTYRWMAPEMISKKRFSKKADVYSFGIVLWELLTGHVPFEDYTPVQAAFAVVHKHARPPLPLNCPSTLGYLLQECWHADPDKRPHFTKVVAVLEEMRESILLNRSISPFHRNHKHAHGLLHCFGRFASHHVL